MFKLIHKAESNLQEFSLLILEASSTKWDGRCQFCGMWLELLFELLLKQQDDRRRYERYKKIWFSVSFVHFCTAYKVHLKIQELGHNFLVLYTIRFMQSKIVPNQDRISSYFRWLTKGQAVDPFSAIKTGPDT